MPSFHTSCSGMAAGGSADAAGSAGLGASGAGAGVAGSDAGAAGGAGGVAGSLGAPPQAESVKTTVASKDARKVPMRESVARNQHPAQILLAVDFQRQTFAGDHHFRAFGVLADPALGALADRVERVVGPVWVVV